MNFRHYTDFVVAKTNQFFIDRIGTNKNIILAADYRPEHNIKIDAEVVTVPNKISQRLFAMNQVGPPMYYEGSPSEVIFTDRIPIIAQPGDKVYIHYNAMMMNYKEPFHIEGSGDNQTIYLKILYERILCIVRDGEIIPNATWTLVEPDMETWDDILIPTYFPANLTGGKKVQRPKKEWLAMKSRPDAKLLQGFVRHVGPPLIGDELDLKQGQKILYKKDADFRVTIEGQEYFLIKQKDIEVIIEEE